MVEISTELEDGAPNARRDQALAPALDVDEATKIAGTLSRIQELFYENSDFKDGPKAGKVNSEQLRRGKVEWYLAKLRVLYSHSL